MNSNTDLRNQQQVHNKGLIQQDFQNKRDLAGMKYDAASNSANIRAQRGQSAAENARKWGQLGTNIFAQYMGGSQNNGK